MSDNLVLKPIKELLEENFFIPSYQRGYRWGEQQVSELLKDIVEFVKDKNKENGFYCLQPVVVKEHTWQDNTNILQGYSVIDGQQRLTTLYLIFKSLIDLLNEEHDRQEIYNIYYETRNNKNNSSYSYLKNIHTEKENNLKNIDFYFMNKAYNTINNFFSTIKSTYGITKRQFLEVLMQTDTKDVQVIWYEIENNENEIDIFTRLNIGKILLTNAELIKALLLLNVKKVNNNEKILLASQWDEIEYKLQNDTFFSFIYSDDFDKPTRIEFIFDLIANNQNLNLENLKIDDDKYSFYIFQHIINNHEKDDDLKKIDLWDETKTYFRIFEELYNNNTYYHLVGFLVNNEVSIKKIVDKFKTQNKDDFLKYLKSEIFDLIKLNKDKKFEKLNYNNDYKLITKILFLFNVISTMNGKFSRYPFDLHKVQNWSLEHIHAQNSEKINKTEDKKELLEDQKIYIKDKKLETKVEVLLAKDKIEDNEFEEIQNDIFALHTDDISVHTLDNMALLSKEDNSSLNNSIFPSKRDKIKKLDLHGSFVPIGTKNVFLKYYSANVKEIAKWNKPDRDAYLVALKEVFNFIGENND